jgi:hypothetical protein
LLTQAVEIGIDDKTMAIEIRPRETDTRMEMDAFIACQVPGAADVEKTGREHLRKTKERPVTPFDPSSYVDLLRLVAGNLESKGSYRELLAKREIVPPPSEHLIVSDNWVIFTRPRLNNFLLDDLKRLQEKLGSGCSIPEGPLALVTPPSDIQVEYEPVRFRGISSRGDSGSGKVEELFFPLPYNEEQITIVRCLERAPGITVQGPPGTGKTHTIANIICHYLATGRRVLVTSRGEPALEVLQSKIPEEVQSLTVALLASDREGMRQFQASISAIQHQVSQLNPGETRTAIANLQSSIDRAHTELARIDRRVDEIAIAQLSEVEIDGQRMRAQQIAELVVFGQDRYGWFNDELSLAPEHAPPLSLDETRELREARRKLGPDLVYVTAQTPSADSLPQASKVGELHDLLARIWRIEEEVTRGALASLKAYNDETLFAARDLIAGIDEAERLAAELEASNNAWSLELRENCRQSSFDSERQALESLLHDFDALIKARAEFLKRPVEVPTDAFTSAKTKEAVARAATTGKPFSLISLGNGEAKKHLSSVRIAGLLPKNAEDWAHVRSLFDLHEIVLSFVTRWNRLAEDTPLPQLQGGINSLREIEQVGTLAFKAHRLALRYDMVLPKKAEAVFHNIPAKQLSGAAADLAAVRESLRKHLTKAELSAATRQKLDLREQLAGKSGPVSGTLRSFIEEELGNPALSPENAATRYAEIMAELRRIGGLAVELAIVRDYSKRIDKAGAGYLAGRVRSIPANSSGEDDVFPSTWRDAWNWSRMRAHLNSIEAREELVALSAKRRSLEEGLARFYKEMVAKAAWLATKGNATQRVLAALAGYATAIRRIGMGTGPNAIRYRRDAREAMLDAAGAVPCWIMSHARISESMPAEIGGFDLVIVDEASQSDLWALPAILRGKKILVVGDDKQVSPDAGFIAAQRIQELKNRFLTDQPYGTEMTPEKSLYDLAARVFAAEQVMLREHFRCVPSIIAYSNRVFYGNQIRPRCGYRGHQSASTHRLSISMYLTEAGTDAHVTSTRLSVLQRKLKR